MKESYPSIDVDEMSKGQEQEGSVKFDQGLSHSLIEGNQQRIEQGMILDSSASQGLFAFNPDMMFDSLVKDYNTAEKIYGETFLRLITGEDAATLKKKLRFPEFQRLLKSQIKDKMEKFKEEGLIDREYKITDKGFELASLVAYMQELNDLRAKGLGERKSKKIEQYGEKQNTRKYKKHDRYQDIAIKSSIKTAVRRGHQELLQEDLSVYEKDSKGKIHLIYALDASGSMKGQKIALCKKAGIALAYKAIEEKDKVGLLVFGSKVEQVVHPTGDFSQFLRALAHIKAKAQTDIAGTISQALQMFPGGNVTKHLILLTDAVPTVGDDPEKKALELAEQAVNSGITISLIGIGLDQKGIEFSKKIVEIGKGRLYIIKNLESLDRIILEDYYALT